MLWQYLFLERENMNQEYFSRLCMDIVPGQKTSSDAPGEIGILAEKTMHRVVKSYMEIRPECHEIKIGRYHADIKNEFGIIEIQTRALSRLKNKLSAFLPEYPVMIVIPLAQTKYVSWIDMETGAVSKRHRSPKKESFYTLTRDLYALRDHITDPHFSLHLLYLETEEFRYLNGWSKDKKKGSERCDRIPLALNDEQHFAKPSDYACFLPDGLPEVFTTAEFGKLAKVPKAYQWYTVALLFKLGLLEQCGKRGNTFLYRKTI